MPAAVHPTRRFHFLLLLFAACLPCHGAGGDTSLLRRGDATLTLQLGDGFSPATRQAIGLWTDFIADALWRVYGRWPRAQWAIVVEPASGSADDPIPWGQVQRGPVDRVEFFILPNASAEELKQAWTGYHELAHLLIPYRGWGDAWFSEGLATYYQNLMQARSGILSEQQMWQKLHDGFMRGRADLRFDGEPLNSVSDGMREHGGFMRVYWSGAWYFLAADTRLRRQSEGRQNLDLALEKLNRCCRDARLSVPEIVARLDQLNDVVLFQPLYEELRSSTQLPPFEPMFDRLGVAVEGGLVELRSDAPDAYLRRKMVARPSL